MFTFAKKARNICFITALVFMMACGSILQGFRAGFNVGSVIADDLVTHHVITQEKADLIKADVSDGIDAAATGEQCVKAATGSDTEKKIAKARCYFKVAQDLRSILARHNIGGEGRLDLIASIANDVIAALEEYFRNVTGEGVSRRAAAAVGDPDKTLEGKMKDAKSRLDALKK